MRMNLEAGRVIIEFCSVMCGSCKMMEKVLEEFEGAYKIDIEKNEKMGEEFRIYNLPTVIFFEDGKEVKRFVGYTTKEKLSWC